MAMLSPTVSAHDETIIPQVNQPQAQHTRVAADHNYSVINDLKQALSDFEEKIIRERLNHFSGDRAKAAQSLGIPKRTLAYKCQKLEIKAL